MEIIQTVKVPMLNYPTPPPPMYTDIPKGLKPRWKPFGHRKLFLLNHKYSVLYSTEVILVKTIDKLSLI